MVAFTATYPIVLALRTKLPAELPVIGKVPDFPGGEPLKGRVWVFDFFAPDCPERCQDLVGKMYDLQHHGKQLGDAFHLISFVTVPATAEELDAFGRARRASPRLWTFLSGPPPPGLVEAVVTALEGRDPAGLEEGRYVVLVDPGFRIRAVYDLMSENAVKRILIDTGLLVERSKGK